MADALNALIRRAEVFAKALLNACRAMRKATGGRWKMKGNTCKIYIAVCSFYLGKCV